MSAAPRTSLLAVTAATLLLSPAVAQAAPKPEMTVRELSSPPASLTAGDSFALTGVVRNKGDKGSPAEVSATLSSQPTPQPGAIPLGGTSTPSVPKDGGERDFSFSAEVPADVEPGTYYQVVCVPRRGTSGVPVCKADPQPVVVAAIEYTPGARTLNDPLFPQVGNGGYDVRRYKIDLRYDPATNLFDSGTNTRVRALATQNLSELALDFQDLAVSSVTVDGVPATFEQVDAEPQLSEDPEVTQPMKLVIDPATGIREGERFTVQVAYSGEPVMFVDADLSIEGWIPACYTPSGGSETCDGAFTVNEPNGAQGWFPANNHPSDKAKFETAITVPTGKVAFGMGELLSKVEDPLTSRTTWTWRSDELAAPYLSTGTVGDFVYTEGSFPEVTTGRTILTYNGIDSSATPAQLASVNASIRRARGQLNFLSERVLGPYPFESIGVVADRAAGVGYALENQTKAHFAGSNAGPSVSANTLLHEIGHQWMGNSVSPETWREIWFNEGWATWLTWYWAYEDNSSQTSPAQQFQNNYANASAADWETPPAMLTDPADLFAGFPVYTRGAMTLEAYRQIVGDSTFFAFSRELAREFKYDNISTEEFIDFALAKSGLEGDDLALLEDFFDEWLYGTTQPQILPDDFDE